MKLDFTEKEFRDSLGLFATGIAIATTTDGAHRIGITINSFASVSLDPPLVLFSVSRNLNSFNAFAQARGFAINVLRQDQVDLSARFARAGEDKWRQVDAHSGQHDGIIIRPSLASFDCRMHCRYEGGDHTIFVGEVTGLVTEGCDAPLIYYGSKYHQLAAAQEMVGAA